MTAPIFRAGRCSPVCRPSRESCRRRWGASRAKRRCPRAQAAPMQGFTHWPRWQASPCALPFRRKTCIARSTGLFPRRYASPKRERYEAPFMRGIRQLPRPTSTGSSVRPSARPFWRAYVYACPWALDLDKLQACARLFEGEYDFQSFAASDPDLSHRELVSQQELVSEPQSSKSPYAPESTSLKQHGPGHSHIHPQGFVKGHGFSHAVAAPQNEMGLQPLPPTVRTIYSSSWELRPECADQLLVYRVRGNGFLHHMVRNLAGTMIDVGRGQLTLEEIPGILAARSRSAAGPTAPARGLFLHSVEYDDRDLLFAPESGCAPSHI